MQVTDAMLVDQHDQELYEEPIDSVGENVAHQVQLVPIKHVRRHQEIEQGRIIGQEILEILKLIMGLIDQAAFHDRQEQTAGVFLGDFLS